MTVTETLLREPVIQAVGWALLHFVWQGALIGVLAAIALRALRHSAADVRYVVATIALALMATMPVVTGVQAWRAAHGASEGRMAPIVTPDVVTPTPGASAVAAANESSTPAAGCTALDASCPSSVLNRIDVERWLPALVFTWMAGVAILALRLAGGWVCLHLMRTRHAIPASPALQAVVQRLTRTLHIRRSVSILQSPAVDGPTVIGWLTPVILLPMSALAGLSPLQVEAILAHELAHIRRHDYFVNLLQSLLETLLFYHPAVWWVSRRIRIEREHCCDDLAVSLCGDPVIYARALAGLEEVRGAATSLAMAASGGALLDRVRRLLAAPATHAGRGPAWLAAAAALLLMLAIIGGPVGQSVAAANGPAIGPAPDSLPELIHLIVNAGNKRQSSDQSPPVPPVAPVPPAPPVPPPDAADAGSAGIPPVPAVPPVAAVPAPPAVAAQSVEFNGTRQEASGNYTWTRNGETLSVKYNGAFTLNDTDTDLVAMSPGSSLRISEGGWFRGRSVEFTADASGNITRRFSVGNSERAFEPEGREWLAKILPRFVRQSGFAAKERVARFLSKGGPSAVLAEISLIEGDYGKKVYFTEVMKQAPLDAANARRLLEQAGREIGSDYELATTLIAAAGKLLVDEATRKAYFDAVRSIDSDYEMRRALTAALERGVVSPVLMAGVLETARALDSDYDAASLLLDVAKRYAIEGELRAPFFNALGTIESSYEKGRVLQALLRRQDISAETLLAVLNAAHAVGSDYETAQVLVAAARSRAISGPARDAYVRAAERLGDYERNRSLAALARAER